MAEIYHHGILGQRWGQRNGPPYPLGASDHSSSEKKAGWRKSIKENKKKSLKAVRRKKKVAAQRLKSLKKAREAKQKKQEFEEKKKLALRKGDAGQLVKMKSELTTDELRDAVSRINYMARLSEVAESTRMTGWKIVDKHMQKVRKIGDWAKISGDTYANLQRLERLIEAREETQSNKQNNKQNNNKK